MLNFQIRELVTPVCFNKTNNGTVNYKITNQDLQDLGLYTPPTTTTTTTSTTQRIYTDYEDTSYNDDYSEVVSYGIIFGAFFAACFLIVCLIKSCNEGSGSHNQSAGRQVIVSDNLAPIVRSQRSPPSQPQMPKKESPPPSYSDIFDKTIEY